MEEFKTIPHTYPQLTAFLIEHCLTMGKYILSHEALSEGRKKCLENEIGNLKILASKWRKGEVLESKLNNALIALKFHQKILINILEQKQREK